MTTVVVKGIPLITVILSVIWWAPLAQRADDAEAETCVSDGASISRMSTTGNGGSRRSLLQRTGSTQVVGGEQRVNLTSSHSNELVSIHVVGAPVVATAEVQNMSNRSHSGREGMAAIEQSNHSVVTGRRHVPKLAIGDDLPIVHHARLPRKIGKASAPNVAMHGNTTSWLAFGAHTMAKLISSDVHTKAAPSTVQRSVRSAAMNAVAQEPLMIQPLEQAPTRVVESVAWQPAQTVTQEKFERTVQHPVQQAVQETLQQTLQMPVEQTVEHVAQQPEQRVVHQIVQPQHIVHQIAQPPEQPIVREVQQVVQPQHIVHQIVHPPVQPIVREVHQVVQPQHIVHQIVQPPVQPIVREVHQVVQPPVQHIVHQIVQPPLQPIVHEVHQVVQPPERRIVHQIVRQPVQQVVRQIVPTEAQQPSYDDTTLVPVVHHKRVDLEIDDWFAGPWWWRYVWLWLWMLVFLLVLCCTVGSCFMRFSKLKSDHVPLPVDRITSVWHNETARVQPPAQTAHRTIVNESVHVPSTPVHSTSVYSAAVMQVKEQESVQIQRPSSLTTTRFVQNSTQGSLTFILPSSSTLKRDTNGNGFLDIYDAQESPHLRACFALDGSHKSTVSINDLPPPTAVEKGGVSYAFSRPGSEPAGKRSHYVYDGTNSLIGVLTRGADGQHYSFSSGVLGCVLTIRGGFATRSVTITDDSREQVAMTEPWGSPHDRNTGSAYRVNMSQVSWLMKTSIFAMIYSIELEEDAIGVAATGSGSALVIVNP